jgi:tRNA pseudouridine38-40 synthase
LIDPLTEQSFFYQTHFLFMHTFFQGEVEKILSMRFNRTVRIVGAGRTDAGVHARGSAFHFDCFKGELLDDSSIQHLQHSMNRMLQKEIIVWNLQQAPLATIQTTSNGTTATFPWHVIYYSQRKLYSYRICTSPAMDPLERYTRHHVDWGNVNITLLNETLHKFEGTHDFRAFSGAIEQKQKKEQKSVNTVRTVYQVSLVEESHGLYRIDILLKGALYKMIRNMVGTAIDVARGRMSTESFLQLLLHPNEQFVRDDNPCKPAPPQGLTLERVHFDDEDF